MELMKPRPRQQQERHKAKGLIIERASHFLLAFLTARLRMELPYATFHNNDANTRQQIFSRGYRRQSFAMINACSVNVLVLKLADRFANAVLSDATFLCNLTRNNSLSLTDAVAVRP